MRSLKLVIAVGLASAMMIVGTVSAKVSEEEAARLDGKDLTPLGGEVAGNADGTIPAWNPKWTGLPPGLEYGGPGEERPNPYADEEPFLIITADNYLEHKEDLSEGQLALFARYPKYEIHAYPSHRDFGFQQRMANKARWNATNTELTEGGEGLQNYNGGLAFPIPQTDREVMKN